MRRFHFELEKILKLRENREKETEIELGKAIGILSVLELRIKNIALEKAAAAKNRFSGNINDILNYELYIVRLDQTRDTLLEEAAKAELEVEKVREIYLDASRDRKIISKLKERREKEYRRRVNLEEIKLIDDLASGRTSRKEAAV